MNGFNLSALRVLVSLGILNKTTSHPHIARKSLPILITQGREGIVTSNLYNGCPQEYKKAWDDYHYLDKA